MPGKKKSKKRSKSQSPLQRDLAFVKKAKSDTDFVLDEAEALEDLEEMLDDNISECSSSDSSQLSDMDKTVLKSVAEPLDKSSDPSHIPTSNTTTTTSVTMSTSVLSSCETVFCCAAAISQPLFHPTFVSTQIAGDNSTSLGSPLPVPPSPMQFVQNPTCGIPGMIPGVAPNIVPGIVPGMPGMMPNMMPNMMPTVPSYPVAAAASVDLSDNDVSRIATKLKSLLTDEIKSIVTVKVEAKTASINAELDELKTFKESAVIEIQTLKNSLDDQEQYSRRMCLRISGIDESDNEDTDKIILELARRMNVDLKSSDIDRSHRVGVRGENLNGQGPRSREIIVKFINYKSRLNFIRGRKVLREKNARVYINEDLTQSRKSLFFKCRQLLKQEPKRIDAAYSLDGNIYIVDNKGRKHRVRSLSDLDPYMGGTDIPDQPRQPRRRLNRPRR